MANIKTIYEMSSEQKYAEKLIKQHIHLNDKVWSVGEYHAIQSSIIDATNTKNALPKWISVEDEVPQEKERVLIYPTQYAEDWDNHNQTGLIVWAAFFDPYGRKKPTFHFYDYSDDCYCEMKVSPTHWMQLPKSPSETNYFDDVIQILNDKLNSHDT